MRRAHVVRVGGYNPEPHAASAALASRDAQALIRPGLSPEERALYSRVRDPRDRAQLIAHERLAHQEPNTARAHDRWVREVNALARSILQRGRLGLGCSDAVGAKDAR